MTGLQVKPMGFPSGTIPSRARIVEPSVEVLEIIVLQQ